MELFLCVFLILMILYTALYILADEYTVHCILKISLALVKGIEVYITVHIRVCNLHGSYKF